MLCEADKEIRNLAEPCGTVGGRIAGIKKPRSRNALLICKTSLLSPMITGWIGVTDSNNFQRSDCNSLFSRQAVSYGVT